MKGQTAPNRIVEESSTSPDQHPRVWPQDDLGWLGQLAKFSQVGKLTDWLASVPLLRVILESAPAPMALLDPERRIAACNASLASQAGLTESQAIGQRMGDLLGCLHARHAPAGCGSSPLCDHCGLKQAVDWSRPGAPATKAWSILREPGGQLQACEFDATVHALPEAGQGWTVCGLRESTDRRRRRVLERIFLHDLLNRVAALESVAQTASDETSSPEDRRESLDLATVLARSIKEEIHAQQILLMAEEGSLVPRFSSFDAAQLLHREVEVARRLDSAWGKHLICGALEPLTVWADPILLGRVLLNLLKNASEATRYNAKVRCGIGSDAAMTVFWVENEGVIPDEVLRHLFHRSFSTKGADRGMGLYSVKLLAEKYLSGRVGFVAAGRTVRFTVTLPAAPPEPA